MTKTLLKLLHSAVMIAFLRLVVVPFFLVGAEVYRVIKGK